MQKLLVIDDNAAFREAITLAGEDNGWAVYADEDLKKITDWLANHSPNVVLFDWELRGQHRQKYAELLQKHRLTECTLLLSSTMNDERKRFVAEYGLAGTKLKPFDLGRFKEEIRLPEPGEQEYTDEQLVKISHEIPVFFDILDRNLNVLWKNKSTEDAQLTPEQRLIAKWLQADIEKDKARNIARRLDWDGRRERFLESKLHRISHDRYVLERDWRDKNERLHDHEFLNLEESKDPTLKEPTLKEPTLEKWLQAVARLLAQRYAISRLRVYKIAPLPNTEGLERKHPPLVVPKFQSGDGIEPNAEAWLRSGFEPKCIPHIEKARQSFDAPAPRWVDDLEDSDICENLARVRYGKNGTSRVLFPVRDPDDERIVALLALDRRLDHIKGSQGFDREVVEIAARMASDEAGVLSPEQWSLMRGLVEDISNRVGRWLQDDEKQRTADWHQSISDALIKTFAEAGHSPEMTYEGISQVCALLATAWNGEISGVIRGSTPWSEQAKKGAPISAWYIVLTEGDSWQLVAGWGDTCETCRQHGGRMVNISSDIIGSEKPWQATVIQEFQTWSKKIPSPLCIPDELYKAIGSWLAVPMQVEGKIRAAMVIHSPHAHYFTAFHTKLLEQAAKRLLPLLAAALRETRARSAFTAAVMHEVKNDSHTALMLLDQMQRKAGQTPWTKSLAGIRHHLESLNALGQDTLDIFQVARDRRILEWKNERKDITTILGDLLEKATLGWCTLYKNTEFKSDLAKELALCSVRIPHNLDFRRVLRILLHNAFRHGLYWVHIAAELQGDADADRRLKLTIRNGAYGNIVSGLRQAFGSAMDNPGASPLTRGRMGLTVAKQLTLEAGGSLSELQYKKLDEDQGQAMISLYWPVEVVA